MFSVEDDSNLQFCNNPVVIPDCLRRDTFASGQLCSDIPETGLGVLRFEDIEPSYCFFTVQLDVGSFRFRGCRDWCVSALKIQGSSPKSVPNTEPSKVTESDVTASTNQPYLPSPVRAHQESPTSGRIPTDCTYTLLFLEHPLVHVNMLMLHFNPRCRLIVISSFPSMSAIIRTASTTVFSGY